MPPDYFSADGQLWGNPLYQWSAHAADGYAWWLARMRATFAVCDVVRIDHFRGFDAYWRIPLPADLFAPARRNSAGLDLNDEATLAALGRAFEQAAALPWRAAPMLAVAAEPTGPVRAVRNPAAGRTTAGWQRGSSSRPTRRRRT